MIRNLEFLLKKGSKRVRLRFKWMKGRLRRRLAWVKLTKNKVKVAKNKVKKIKERIRLIMMGIMSMRYR
jgi:hypothetical protein